MPSAGSRAKRGSQYMQRHVNDEWVRAAQEHGYRSRAAWKLCQIDDRHKVLGRGVRAVLDLGAAPGSWTQVLVERVNSPRLVVGVDLLPVEPFSASLLRRAGSGQSSAADAVKMIEGDFTTAQTRRHIETSVREWRRGSCAGFDAVVSDMVPSITGDHVADHYSSVRLCRLIMEFLRLETRRADPRRASRDGRGGDSRSGGVGSVGTGRSERASGRGVGRPDGPAAPMLVRGGSLTMKVLQGRDLDEFIAELREEFGEVRVFKPKASRPASREVYVVAKKAH